MAYFTTSIAMTGGVCIGIGVLFLFVGLRRPTGRVRNVLFSLFALAYGGAIMTARMGYLADTPAEHYSAVRVSAVFASIGFALLVWFVAAYTRVRPRRLLWTMTGAFAVTGLASAFLPESVVDVNGSVSVVTLPWGETLLMGQGGDGPLFMFGVLAQLAMLVYIVGADVLQFRRGSRRDASVLAIGVLWFLFTLVEENLVLLGTVDLVVLADFGFFGFVAAMSLAVANDVIETEAELLDLRSSLEEQVEERTAQLEEAQALLVMGAEEKATAAERSRLAQELHDVVTQLLFSINLIAGSLSRLWHSDPAVAERTTGELQRLTRGALAEMRTLLRELRPQGIAETDLGTLVTHLSEGLAARHDIPSSVHTEVTQDLPPEVHIAFYRIAQEAMNNVAKHANASSLVVDLTGDDGQVRLSVTDDGYGFDPADVRGGTMGLEIMRERASGIGAEISIASDANAGTSVDLRWNNRSRAEQR
jgi:signal transduction histidine kinase